MAESSLCIPTCSKFTTFLQNLRKVFGLTLVKELKFWILPLLAFMSFSYLYLLFYLLRTRLKTNSSSDLEEIFSTFLKGALQFMTQQNWRQFQSRKYLFEKITWRWDPWRTSYLVPVVSLPFVFLSAKSYSLIFSWYLGSIFSNVH